MSRLILNPTRESCVIVNTERRRIIRKVREAVRGKFDEAGWDTQSNSPTRDEPPTLEELYAFLDSTIDVLEAFDLPIGALPLSRYLY